MIKAHSVFLLLVLMSVFLLASADDPVGSVMVSKKDANGSGGGLRRRTASSANLGKSGDGKDDVVEGGSTKTLAIIKNKKLGRNMRRRAASSKKKPTILGGDSNDGGARRRRLVRFRCSRRPWCRVNPRLSVWVAYRPGNYNQDVLEVAQFMAKIKLRERVQSGYYNIPDGWRLLVYLRTFRGPYRVKNSPKHWFRFHRAKLEKCRDPNRCFSEAVTSVLSKKAKRKC